MTLTVSTVARDGQLKRNGNMSVASLSDVAKAVATLIVDLQNGYIQSSGQGRILSEALQASLLACGMIRVRVCVLW